MATTVDSEQVKGAVRETYGRIATEEGPLAVAAAPDVAAPAHRRARTRLATPMRNAAVLRKGLIWASAVGTLRRFVYDAVTVELTAV